MSLFFKKGAQVGGRTWDLFDFRLFSLTSSALDHSATAPPSLRPYLATKHYQTNAEDKFVREYSTGTR